MKRTLITSALPYANGFLHLGHCAGAYLPADIYSRYKRLSGEELIYICGSDEHGVAITIAAEKEKVTPKQIIDKYHNANKDAFIKFGMSFDIYSRTSNQIHHETAKEFFSCLLSKGILNEKEEEQFYDPKANMFLPDRYVEGICPNCGFDHARGDQCDSCGAYYNQLELKNPKSLVSGDTPIVKKTIHWYLRFDLFQDFLENYIESHSNDWKDNVLQQTRSWLKQGLNERAITRDLNWGVKLDDIPNLDKEKSLGKVLYVWFEAVLGYISATKELFQSNEISTQNNEEWKKWWKDSDTRYLAFIGKDNIVFHTLIFPTILNAVEDGYILPDNVPANEFLNLEGQKFSKSRNWSIDLKDFIEDFPDESRIDALRYTLAMDFPETRDADFTWKNFQTRNNSELAAIFGNFVNRTLQFLSKNFNLVVPELSDKYENYLNDWKKYVNDLSNNDIPGVIEENYPSLNSNDLELLKSLSLGIDKIINLYERFKFRDALTETMNIARAANKYFNDEEPWKTIKSNSEQCAKTLFTCVQIVKSLSVIFSPVLPFTSERLNSILGINEFIGEANKGIPIGKDVWNEAKYPQIPMKSIINEPSILFSLIEDDVVKIQIEKLGNMNKIEEVEKTSLITIDDFMNIKLKTAKVIEAEKIKKSKKLLKLIVDLGTEKKQILAGIAEHYKPEDLVGKTVVVVSNLQPAKLMGIESQGMILAANSPDGLLKVVTVDGGEFAEGSEVR